MNVDRDNKRKWYQVDVETVLDELQTDGTKGLRSTDIKQRKEQFGTNHLT